MINRRTFLKLFGMSLATAGVTMSTIAAVFPQEQERGERPDRMAVAEAIRKLVARQKAAVAKLKQECAADAIRIMSEAHRDFSLAWAGGAITLYCEIGGSLVAIVKAARHLRDEPTVSPFLNALKATLLNGTEAEGQQLQLDAFMAYAEMEGLSQAEAYAKFCTGSHQYTAGWFHKHKPGHLAEIFGLVKAEAA